MFLPFVPLGWHYKCCEEIYSKYHSRLLLNMGVQMWSSKGR